MCVLAMLRAELEPFGFLFPRLGQIPRLPTQRVAIIHISLWLWLFTFVLPSPILPGADPQ